MKAAVTAGIVTLAMLLSGAGASARAAGADADASGPKSAARAMITVHGHWTIEVRNPNGSVASHTEFENALVTEGASFLSQVLARQMSPGPWLVGLFGPTSPCLSGGSSSPCVVGEPGVFTIPVDSTHEFPTLTVSLINYLSLVFSGTAVASQDGSINLVATQYVACAPTFAPASPCSVTANNIYSTNSFTSARLNTPINVSAGQTIAVTVNISFS